jgi:hypothetical protein
MSSNTLDHLAGHLFAQLERLDNKALTPEQMRDEIARAGAVTSVANAVIASGRLAVDWAKVRNDLPPGEDAGVLGLTGPDPDKPRPAPANPTPAKRRTDCLRIG